MHEPPSAALAGSTLGHYRFTSLIGAGGMGQVYLAHDERLDRDVAVKVLPSGLLSDEGARRRFRTEALTLSQLNHPNIATIHDFQTVGDRDLLVMEYVPGANLADLLTRTAFGNDAIARLGTQLAQGLAAAHARGVIHRDLKPGNVRVTPDGHLKILDYGLAQFAPAATGDLSTYTGGEAVSPYAGTPAYMAPEQIRGGPVDARTDIYAAGAILYELATGRRAYTAAHPFALVDQKLHSTPVAPRAINPAIAPALERIIVKAMERAPGLRYQRAEELAVDLRRLGREPDLDPTPRRRRLRSLIGVTALTLVLGTLIWHDGPAPVTAFGPRDWIVVADVAGPSGGRHDVREALTLTLRQSRYLNVLPREQVIAALQRMERPPGAPVDESAGLEVCRRENAKVLLAPAVQMAGGETWISVRALDATGRLLFVERARLGPTADIFAAIDALAGRVRRVLGESLDQIAASRPLAQVTTRSTDALERYSRAVDQAARGQLSEAEGSLRAALAADAAFAMAHFQLARVYLSLGARAGEVEHVEAAYAHRQRVTDRERYLIEAAYAEHRDEFERAERSLRTLVGLFPDDGAGRLELGLGLGTNGKLVEAAAQLREALRLDPYSSRAYSKLALVLAEDNRCEEALSVVRSASEHVPDTPELRWAHGMALFGLDRVDEARRRFESMARSTEESERLLGELYRDRILIYEGRLAQAAERLAAAVRIDREAGRAYPERIRRYLLGRTALLRGDATAARQQAAAMLQGEDVRVEHLRHAGYLQALAGDGPAAERTLARLRSLLEERPNAFGRSSALLIEGALAARRGRDAAERLRQADAAFPNYYARIGVAEQADSRAEWAMAVSAWEQVLASRGVILRDGFPADLALAELRRARALRRLGRLAEAESGFNRVAALWANGDDTAFGRQARDELRQLSTRRPQ
jgi:Tfp pilus assembly protein PilF